MCQLQIHGFDWFTKYFPGPWMQYLPRPLQTRSPITYLLLKAHRYPQLICLGPHPSPNSQSQTTAELQKLSSSPSQHKNSRVLLMLQLPVELVRNETSVERAFWLLSPCCPSFMTPLQVSINVIICTKILISGSDCKESKVMPEKVLTVLRHGF